MTKRKLFFGHVPLRVRIKIRLSRIRAWLMARRHIGRFGWCPGCGQWRTDIERRRQMTQYTHEPSNWNTHCADCQKDADQYWEALWQDYYQGLL